VIFVDEPNDIINPLRIKGGRLPRVQTVFLGGYILASRQP
jgi:hypothetical protein